MFPRQVFTHRNGVQVAARLPEPVAIGKWAQPAFSTADQQDRPSLTTLAPGAKSRSAIFSTSRLRKPLTTVSRRRRGFLSAVVSTAAPLAAVALAAEIGVVDLDPAGKLGLRGLARPHRPHQLVLHQPGRLPPNPE